MQQDEHRKRQSTLCLITCSINEFYPTTTTSTTNYLYMTYNDIYIDLSTFCVCKAVPTNAKEWRATENGNWLDVS